MRILFLFSILVLTQISQLSATNDTLRLVFLGDIMQHLPQINAAKAEDGSFSYDSCFSFIAPVITEADFAVANLELTLSGPPYSGYPHFSAPDAIAKSLKNAGFDMLATANNHSCDRGKKGVVRTLDVLDENELLHVGTSRNSSEKAMLYPRIVEVKNFKLGFLSYTYGTNGMPIIAPTLVNLIDTVEISKDYERLLKQKPDFVICIIHWGEEYTLNQIESQKRLAEFMFEKGIDLIIGSHPHVIQPMESALDSNGNFKRAVYYSLGNAISNQNDEHTDIGATAHVLLVKDKEKTSMANCSYSLVWRYRKIRNNKREYYMLPVNDFYEKANFFSETEFKHFRKTADNTRKRLSNKNINITETKNYQKYKPTFLRSY